MATYPVYPATTFTQAVELTIFASNQLHDVINGDALTTVETENGDVPTLRKALVDNFYFKTPINWAEGESSTVFNQLYYFDGTVATSGWYYAPQATVDNPVTMGGTPLSDDNWRLYQTATQSIPAQVYPWSTEITEALESISPPYEFDTAIVVLNGIVLVPGPDRDYTITDSVITFNTPLEPDSDAEYPDVLFCYLGKVEEGNAETNYITYENLAKNTAANLIGTSYGISVEEALDPTLRSNLASSEDGLGAALVGLPQGTVQDALHNIINVEAFREANVSDSDWGPAFRAAISYAKSLGGGIVRFAGDYTISSVDTVGWVMPFDDGTIDPARISAGTDSTLPSETEVTMPVHLNIPSGVSLVGDGVSTSSITFTWNWSSRPININQPVGICIRVNNWDGSYIAAVGAKNRMMAAISNTDIGGFTINNCFIPIVADGVIAYGEWPALAFKKCAFSVLALGSEMTKFDGFSGSETLSGPVFGGWWLQRNDLTYQGGVYVPPYVSGTDVYSLGWCDSVVIDVLKYDFPYWSDSAYSPSYTALDKFFDDYIWKTANSMTTGQTTPTGGSGTGRLSTKAADYTTASTLQSSNPFRGVSTRALSIIPRYNRGNSSNRVKDMKTRGTSRPPVLVGPSSPSGNVVSIDNAFVERSCLANMSLTSNRTLGGTNDWFTVGGDIWNSDITKTPYYVGQNLVTTVLVSSASSIAAMPSQSNLGGNGGAVNTIVGPNTSTTMLSRTTLYDPSTGEWSLARESYKGFDYVPRIRFTSDSAYQTNLMFTHGEKILNAGECFLFSLSGGVYSKLSPSSLQCKMTRTGSVVRCTVKFLLTASDIAGSGQFAIGFKRYSVYDSSKGASTDFLGSYARLSIVRGSLSSSVNAAAITSENTGNISYDGVQFIMFKIYKDLNASSGLIMSELATANTQIWEIEYESFSNIDAIDLTP